MHPICPPVGSVYVAFCLFPLHILDPRRWHGLCYEFFHIWAPKTDEAMYAP